MRAQNMNLSIFHDIEDRYHAEVKHLKRKKALLKAKLMLTAVLPVFIILLAVKTAKTLIRIKARDLFAKPETPAKPVAPAKPMPAKIETVKKEIIRPLPADNCRQE